jgi:hypothetical protein
MRARRLALSASEVMNLLRAAGYLKVALVGLEKVPEPNQMMRRATSIPLITQ